MGKVASDLAVSARFSRLDRERWREVNVFGAMVSPPKDNLVVWARGRRTSGKAEEAARFEKSLGLWSKLRVGDRMLRVSDEGGVWTLPPSNSGDVAGAAETGESDRMTLLFRKR